MKPAPPMTAIRTGSGYGSGPAASVTAPTVADGQTCGTVSNAM